MQDTSPFIRRLVWAILGLVILGIFAGYLRERSNRNQTPPLPILSQIPEFTLTNQAGVAVGRSNLLGKIWIADIIFTRCAGPCPRMTAQMASLQTNLPSGSNVQLITLTTDPEFDRPEILKRYGQRFGADFGRWTFLTGTKTEIKSVAIDGLKLIAAPKKADEQENAADLFVHTTKFVVVDEMGRVRASFDGDDPGMTQNALAIINQLAGTK